MARVARGNGGWPGPARGLGPGGEGMGVRGEGMGEARRIERGRGDGGGEAGLLFSIPIVVQLLFSIPIVVQRFHCCSVVTVNSSTLFSP